MTRVEVRELYYSSSYYTTIFTRGKARVEVEIPRHFINEEDRFTRIRSSIGRYESLKDIDDLVACLNKAKKFMEKR